MVLPDTTTVEATILFPAVFADPLGLCLGTTVVEEFVRGTFMANLFEPLCTGNCCWEGFAAKDPRKKGAI